MSNHRINSKRRREFVSKLIQRDGDRCVHCGIALDADVTLEHIVPRKRGGKNELGNLALAHRKCNEWSDRGGGMDAEQRRELAALVLKHEIGAVAASAPRVASAKPSSVWVLAKEAGA